MPFIQITMAEGRTDKQKRDLLHGIDEVVQSTIGAAPASIRIWIVEVPRTAVMSAGEILADRPAPPA